MIIFLPIVSTRVIQGVKSVQSNVRLNVERDILSVDEMGEVLGVSRSQIYNMVNRDQIPYVRVGSRVRFIKSQIEAWLSDGGTKEEVN